MEELLRSRSVRTLAWLGDAAYEHEVRCRIAKRGDYPTDRLDAVKADVVRAQAQASMLAEIDPALSPSERDLARRGRNAALPTSARGRKNTREYREATAFEVLMAQWSLSGELGRQRFLELLDVPLEAAIDRALAKRLAKPRRG